MWLWQSHLIVRRRRSQPLVVTPGTILWRCGTERNSSCLFVNFWKLFSLRLCVQCSRKGKLGFCHRVSDEKERLRNREPCCAGCTHSNSWDNKFDRMRLWYLWQGIHGAESSSCMQKMWPFHRSSLLSTTTKFEVGKSTRESLR